MTKPGFDKDKLINHWIASSDEDFETMIILFESKKYVWALFVGHLMVEKLLKALFIKENGHHPPLIHNLLRLAEKDNLSLSKDQEIEFATITAFNINTRYDDYKNSFQKICTPDFTEIWIEKLKLIRLWIKEQIKA